ncbi:MAG TPA: MOSC domain-containing protein [Acidimicrobiales bacterium]|nr:MOSC domain-containing protein [Acidimicrobiales bacterium]
MSEVTLVAVSVAQPEEVAGWRHRGHGVRTGIRKRPVAAATLALSTTNLEGDGQADLAVHGGPDKAVYAYPSEHWPVWEAEIGRPFGPAAFGENLTTAGATEDDVRIGDRWHWGDAVLEVCQPRTPCFKLALHSGTAEVGRRMRATGRSGWYLRVLRTGTVPTAGPVAVEAHPAGVTVAAVTAAARSGDPDAIAAVLAVAALADEWRVPLRQALAT